MCIAVGMLHIIIITMLLMTTMIYICECVWMFHRSFSTPIWICVQRSCEHENIHSRQLYNVVYICMHAYLSIYLSFVGSFFSSLPMFWVYVSVLFSFLVFHFCYYHTLLSLPYHTQPSALTHFDESLVLYTLALFLSPFPSPTLSIFRTLNSMIYPLCLNEMCVCLCVHSRILFRF